MASWADHPGCAVTEFELNVLNDHPDLMALCEAKDRLDAVVPRWPPPAEDIATISALREVLTSDGRTLAQGALAWIWGRSLSVVPIPGARTVAQLTDNAGALAKGPLTPDQMQQVDRLLSADAV